MRNKKGLFIVGVIAAGLLGGLLGGFNLHWSRMPAFPVYGYVFNAIVIPLLFTLIFFVRKLKAATTDEFAVAKKGRAALTGLTTGMVLFLLTGTWPIFSPGTYHAFIAWTGSADDVFTMGRMFGMAPFLIGLVVGQISAWMKYR